MQRATHSKHVFLSILAVSVLIPIMTAVGQTPELINYQGRLIDGTDLVNGTVQLVLELYSTPTGGELVYRESQSVTVVDGLFATHIGSNAVPGRLTEVLQRGDVYLQTVVDGVPLSPRERLTSVPYAIVATSMPAGAVTTATIQDGAIVNSDISAAAAIAASKIADGSGSGLDADLLDSIEGSGYLRSNASDTFESGTLSVAASAMVDVNGQLHAETLHVGSNSARDDDYVYFDAANENIMWDDSLSRFTMSDELRVNGPISCSGEIRPSHLIVGSVPFGSPNYNNMSLGRIPASGEMSSVEDLFVGFDLEVGDDVCLSGKMYMEGTTNTGADASQTIYFYEQGNREGEYLKWDDTLSRFSLSDELHVQNINFDASTSVLYNNMSVSTRPPSSGEMNSGQDLFVGFDLEVGDDVCLSGKMYMEGTTNTGADASQTIYFYEAGSRKGEYLMWDDADDSFFFSDAVVVSDQLEVGEYVTVQGSVIANGALYLGSFDGTDDDAIYFDANLEMFWWDNSDTRFVLSDDLVVQGTLSKSAGSFKIDHPLDPANKYLSHSFVESPDMKNIYDGIVQLDETGSAVVSLPDWFGALNRDFRYQLTAIGGSGPNLHIAAEVENNQFKIAGGSPGLKVSWQVTGIRQDAYANAHRIPVEEDKTEAEKGHYIHPALFGAPESACLTPKQPSDHPCQKQGARQ